MSGPYFGFPSHIETRPDVIGEMLRKLVALPPEGKPAAELTDRERLAVAYAAQPDLIEFDIFMNVLTMKSRVDFAVADRQGGGYWVARTDRS